MKDIVMVRMEEHYGNKEDSEESSSRKNRKQLKEEISLLHKEVIGEKFREKFD